METCVVIIENIDYVNNFESTGVSFIRDGIRFIVVKCGPLVEQDENGQLVKNHDLLIRARTNDSTDGLSSVQSDVDLVRYNKHDQAMIVAGIVDNIRCSGVNKLDHFRAVRSFNKTAETPFTGRLIIPFVGDKPLYIRFSHGARGVGNCIFDPRKANLHSFLQVLYSEATDKLSEFAHAFTMNRGMINFNTDLNNELAIRKTQQINVTELIDNIACESRVCLNYKSEVFFTEVRPVRNAVPKAEIGSGDELLKNDNIPQFYDDGRTVPITYIGDHIFIPDHPSFPTEVAVIIKQEIIEVLSKLPPMNSVDLFFTEDGKWGIFEFCNQFSIDDMSYSMAAIDAHREFIANVYKKKLEKGKF